MRWLKDIVLVPLSWLYGLIAIVRNWLYDEHIFQSHTVSVPTIGVGNLAVGGTGKTPMVEYLIRMLGETYKVGVLSRGYGRKTKGFVLANEHATALTVGDEIMQMHTKFPDVPMAVCANRYKGMQQLLLIHPEVEVVILDDAFQHRAFTCSFYILLTPHDRLYVKDHLMPWGRLREPAAEAKRAQIIVVSKCPDTMQPIERRIVTNQLKPYASQQVFFSYIRYNNEPTNESVLLLTGIAHTDYLQQYVQSVYDRVEVMAFPDHHTYTKRDVQRIQALAQGYDVILTTEKDMARLQTMDLPEDVRMKLRVIPIETDMRQDKTDFDNRIYTLIAEQIHKQKILKGKR